LKQIQARPCYRFEEDDMTIGSGPGGKLGIVVGGQPLGFTASVGGLPPEIQRGAAV
jgi:hypothetical protein